MTSNETINSINHVGDTENASLPLWHQYLQKKIFLHQQMTAAPLAVIRGTSLISLKGLSYTLFMTLLQYKKYLNDVSKSWQKPSPSLCSPWLWSDPVRDIGESLEQRPWRGWRRPSWWRWPLPARRTSAGTWSGKRGQLDGVQEVF